MPLQIRRGVQAERDDLVTSYVPLAAGEPLFTTDDGNLYVGDGVTPGGIHVNPEPTVNLETYSGIIGEIEKDPITDPGLKSPFIQVDGETASIDLDGQITSDVVPSTNEVYNLGSENFRFRKIWVSGNGIELGEAFLFNNGPTLVLPAGSLVGTEPIATGQGITPGDTYNINIGSDDSTIIVNSTTGVITGTLKGNVVTQSNDLIIDIGNRAAYLSELTFSPGSLVNGDPVFLTNGTTFLSIADGLSIAPTVSATAILDVGNFGASFNIAKGRGTPISPEIVQDGDTIGSLEFLGFDGTDINFAAQLISKVEGTPVVGQTIPAILEINISDGSTPKTTVVFKPTQIEAVVPVVFPNVTSVERDNLTPVVGMIIYNTTTNKFQGFQNTGGITPEWVDLS